MNKEQRTESKEQRVGFTLIELLVVVTLIGILAAVSTNLFVSVLKAYNKAQIVSEIEQNGNAVVSRLEQQIRNAASASSTDPSSISVTDQDGAVTVFSFTTATSLDNPAVSIGVLKENNNILTNYHSVTGVNVVIGESSFTVTAVGKTQNVKIVLKLEQAPNAPGRIDYQAEATLETTVVVRGGYNQ